MTRDAIAILSTKNLLHNVRLIKSILKKGRCENIIAMVKANAYGHGLRSISKRLDGEVYAMGVASIDEAMALRQVGVKSNILLMEGIFHYDEITPALENNFHIVINNLKQIHWFINASLINLNENNKIIPKLWLKYDTGMSRLGFNTENDLYEAIRLIKTNNLVDKISLMSHFCCADNKNHRMNNVQINKFHKMIDNIKKEFPNIIDHISFVNSAGILNFKTEYYDIARPGLLLYGVSPVEELPSNIVGLKPVMHLITKVLTVKNVPHGSVVGYCGDYVCDGDARIAIIAFGYGDGYPLNLSEEAYVIIKNHKCNIVGRVSMDMMAVNVTSYPDIAEGDDVTLWGEGLPVEEVAKFSNETPWTLFCGIQNRVKFHWLD